MCVCVCFPQYFCLLVSVSLSCLGLDVVLRLTTATHHTAHHGFDPLADSSKGTINRQPLEEGRNCSSLPQGSRGAFVLFRRARPLVPQIDIARVRRPGFGFNRSTGLVWKLDKIVGSRSGERFLCLPAVRVVSGRRSGVVFIVFTFCARDMLANDRSFGEERTPLFDDA